MFSKLSTLLCIAVMHCVVNSESASIPIPALDIAAKMGESEAEVGELKADWYKNGEDWDIALGAKVWESPDKYDNIALGGDFGFDKYSNGEKAPETGGAIVFTHKLDYI